MDGGKQNERGKNLMRAVGMAGKDKQAHSPQNKALQADTASGLSARHRPQTNSQQMAGLAAKQLLPPKLACLSPCSAGKWGSTVVLAAKKAGADLPSCSYPTYRLCLSLSLPTPLICKTQFSPKLTFFFFYFTLYSPTINSSPNPL